MGGWHPPTTGNPGSTPETGWAGAIVSFSTYRWEIPSSLPGPSNQIILLVGVGLKIQIKLYYYQICLLFSAHQIRKLRPTLPSTPTEFRFGKSSTDKYAQFLVPRQKN